MKKTLALFALTLCVALMSKAAGWPENYGGVMLQGFYWDSYGDSRWTNLESQADELAEFFSLVWIPQSGNCGGSSSMGYDDLYWFTNYRSSFGTESELRSMIKSFNSKGIGTIADVVINHRKTLTNWVDFPAETYNGVTYQLQSTDICKGDDGGETLTWATSNGYSLSSNYDTGEDWSGMRDLDHKSENVQTNVKAYLNFLLNDLGYAGFRYDMTKGYSATYTGLYNTAAKPTYSVGEYWDGNVSALTNWLNGTKVDGEITSAAFDFAFRYVVRDAVNGASWTKLHTTSTLNTQSTKEYRQHSVTFVENHDTQYRNASEQQDPIKQYIPAANAYMLAMPGTPCVFLRHWLDYKEEIKQMIYARQAAGVTNTSTSMVVGNNSSKNYYARRSVGTNGTLLGVYGETGNYTLSSTYASYVKVASGDKYYLALSPSCETPWVDKPSGDYDETFTVTMTAISETSTAKLVYTTDGSTPTATNGTTVSSGSTLNITESTVLKVGLLVNGSVTKVITRTYNIDLSEFEPYDITVYLKDPTVDPNNWPQVAYYVWDKDNKQLCGNWPGTVITDTKTINGVKFYYKDFTITSKDYYVNFVFSQGGSNASSYQTVDVNFVNTTSFFEVTTQTNKYEVENVTDSYIGYLDGPATGDVNADGEVNIADVNALISIILGNSKAEDYAGVADVNGDAEINIADVNAVIAIILGD